MTIRALSRSGAYPNRYVMSPPTDPADDLLARSVSPQELPDERTSLSLLALAQQGDRRALEELVTRYQSRLRRIVHIQLRGSTVGHYFDSMDIVQDTFRAALPHIEGLQPHSAAGLLSWLANIATNRIRDAHDYLRADKRDVGRESPEASASAEAALHGQAKGRNPAEEATLREVRELLDEEVSKLSEDQRRVVLLRDYCGEDWDEIAAELERENGAARQLYQRAWIRLRQALRPKLEGRSK